MSLLVLCFSPCLKGVGQEKCFPLFLLSIPNDIEKYIAGLNGTPLKLLMKKDSAELNLEFL